MGCKPIVRAFWLAAFLGLSFAAHAQEPVGTESPNLQPSWETQKRATAYALAIPAPRGQITDRNGVPLAQTRVTYNLAVVFPTPLNMSDPQVTEFVTRQAGIAKSLVNRPVNFLPDAALQHYRNRGLIPFDLVTDLTENQAEELRKRLPPDLILRPIYVRFYPQGSLAGQVVGYIGRTSRVSTRVLQNNDPLWPESEGREGLEQTFDEQLRGKDGQLELIFDKDGRKTGERIAVQPEPGYNVVTTLDVDLQRLAEKILEKRCRRGALVVLDPHNGEVLALASWPTFNPNDFVPSISEQKFQKLANDPNIPLLPRAFRSAYPAGSTFKVFMGLAGFQTHRIDPDTSFDCTPAMQIGNLVFHNWRRSDAGDLVFTQALTQSCNTWFYHLGLRLGAAPMVEWAGRLGLGKKTGVSLNGEADGRIPSNDYMEVTYHRRFAPGDLANFAIGQGDILISPLQMAQAMGTIANGGTLYQTRIVRQVQTLNNEVVYTYPARARDILNLESVTREELRHGMIGVVASDNGTAGAARVDGVKVAGKTGTAQWGPKEKEKTAAWFAGFAPAENSQYAFAALYEGNVGEKVHGGSQAAPMIGQFLRTVFKNESETKKDHEKQDEMSDEGPSGSDQSD
jgi:penicillin-binding protein 2